MVSVIIPVFNSEKYIEECLNSILVQTYTNYEIIVIDDGSTDSSHKIIERYVSKYNKIKYFYQKNGGAAIARNLGVGMAIGKYLMFVDSDDYIAPDALTLMVNKLEHFKADMGVIGHIKINNSNNEFKEFLYDVDDKQCYTNTEVLDLALKLKIRGYICDKLFLKDKWNNLNLTFEENRYCEDWFPVIKYILNSEKIVFVNKGIYFYRQHVNSSIHTSNLKVIGDYNYVVKTIIDYVQAKKVKVNTLETFKMLTFIETIHELYLVVGENKHKIYSGLKDNRLNSWDFKMKNILGSQNISSKNKLVIILWKLRLYHLFKLISKVNISM